MNFFDDLLKEVDECISGFEQKSYQLGRVWEDAGRNEVVLQRDSQYELDGVGFNIVTSKCIGEDEIIIIGDDLNEISSDRKFARISLIQINDIDDEQKAYNLIKKIEYSKYHYYPKGFMIRTASSSHKGTVRVSKAALSKGLSLEGVGNILINKYKEIDAVCAVKLIYITDKAADYDRFEKAAEHNYNIAETLNHIMNSVNFDCTTCNLKPICDEVEGMKELHFKNSMK